MDSVTYIFRVPFDHRSPAGFEQTPEWLTYRMRFFHEFTLQSLLNQTEQDFRIFLLCNKKNSKIRNVYKWHPRVELCEDMGRSRYEAIDTDYVAILRIDSDDLLHREALANIKEGLIVSDRRECMIFRKLILWNVPCGYIKKPRPYYDPAPPYTVHTFPKAVYRDWENFDMHHNVGHGNAGGLLPETVELPEYRICVVKHWMNTGRIKRGKRLVTKSKPNGAIVDKDKMAAILSDFGIKRSQLKTDYKIN